MIQFLAGVLSGIISGMGMGGGTILIMILTCFFSVNQIEAQATNLMYFIPTSLIAILINIKNKKIDFKIAIPIAMLGVIGAIIGSYIAIQINIIILRKCFASFLMIIAIYESFYWYKKYIKRNNNTRNKNPINKI